MFDVTIVTIYLHGRIDAFVSQRSSILKASDMRKYIDMLIQPTETCKQIGNANLKLIYTTLFITEVNFCVFGN